MLEIVVDKMTDQYLLVVVKRTGRFRAVLGGYCRFCSGPRSRCRVAACYARRSLARQQAPVNNDALALLLEQNRQLQAEVQALRGMVEEQGFELRNCNGIR